MGLSDHEKRIVLAIGQTMFPRDAVLGIDADDAGLAAWVDQYVGRMPPAGRNQIRALLRAFDLGFAPWSGRPSNSFVRARPADRAAYLETWERSTLYTQRMLYDAIRTMLTFGYMDAEVVDRHIRPDEHAPSEAPAQQVAAVGAGAGAGGSIATADVVAPATPKATPPENAAGPTATPVATSVATSVATPVTRRPKTRRARKGAR